MNIELIVSLTLGVISIAILFWDSLWIEAALARVRRHAKKGGNNAHMCEHCYFFYTRKRDLITANCFCGENYGLDDSYAVGQQ